MTQPSQNRFEHRIARLKHRARLLGRRPPPSRLALALASPKLRAAIPWYMTALILGLSGLGLISTSVTLATEHQQSLADALTPVGAMLLAASMAPVILGSLRLTDLPQRSSDHCGQCRFYIPSASGYTRGVCHVERPCRATTSDQCCPRFQFSERAMVRERLNAAPHVLNPATKSHE